MLRSSFEFVSLISILPLIRVEFNKIAVRICISNNLYKINLILLKCRRTYTRLSVLCFVCLRSQSFIFLCMYFPQARVHCGQSDPEPGRRGGRRLRRGQDHRHLRHPRQGPRLAQRRGGGAPRGAAAGGDQDAERARQNLNTRRSNCMYEVYISLLYVLFSRFVNLIRYV